MQNQSELEIKLELLIRRLLDKPSIMNEKKLDDEGGMNIDEINRLSGRKIFVVEEKGGETFLVVRYPDKTDELAEQWCVHSQGYGVSCDHPGIKTDKLDRTIGILRSWQPPKGNKEDPPALSENAANETTPQKQTKMKCKFYHPEGTSIPEKYQLDSRPCGPMRGHETELAYAVTNVKNRTKLRTAAKNGAVFVIQQEDRLFDVYSQSFKEHHVSNERLETRRKEKTDG